MLLERGTEQDLVAEHWAHDSNFEYTDRLQRTDLQSCWHRQGWPFSESARVVAVELRFKSNSRFSLINVPQACDIFWRVRTQQGYKNK